MNRCHYKRDRYFAWNGIILVLAGVILLLDRLGIVPASEILRFWPVVLVGAGTVLLVELRSLVARTISGVLIAAGLILQASNLGFVRIRGELFWPLALIGIGVVLLGRAMEEHRRPPVALDETRPHPDFANRFWDGAERFRAGAERFAKNLETDYGERASVFSHIRHQVTGQDFERMKVVAVFGGFELDLRGAGIKGDEAVVDAAAVFGGVEVIVPNDWQVVARGAGVFGGFSDETQPPENPTKRLIVTGAGVFGGVVITNKQGHWSQRHERAEQRMRAWKEARERRWHNRI